jgi:hypothetical protein
MAKKQTNEVVATTNTVDAVTAAAIRQRGVADQLPAHMQQSTGAGAETLRQFIRPPRVKVVQKTAQAPINEHFNTGDIILVPNMFRLAEMEYGSDHKPKQEGPSLKFVPLFFFPEWIAWNPIEWKGTQPAVHERSTDPRSAVAVRAKTQNNRSEVVGKVDGKDIFRNYCEHLNFVVKFIGEEAPDEPCVMSFSRASHKHGSNFARILHQRKADIFGCVFEGFAKFEANAKGDWYAINVANPADGGAWVTDEAAYENYKEAHLELKSAHEAGLIDVDHDDQGTEGSPADSTRM